MYEIEEVYVTTATPHEEVNEGLSRKSRKLYHQQYEAFLKWCSEKNMEGYSEDVLLVYFMEKSKIVRAASLWAHYSMLKATLNVEQNIDISKYPKLIAFLKKENGDYKAKQSKVLTTEQIEQFLKEAPDREFLMIKVALILGVEGACRGNELAELSINDVTELGSALLFKITNSENKIDRSFIIQDDENKDLKLTEMCKKYISLRKEDTPHTRFFVQFRDNKCTTRPLGKNGIGKLPQKIAEYLNLPDVTEYTGHCFRRTSAEIIKLGVSKASGEATEELSSKSKKLYHKQYEALVKWCGEKQIEDYSERVLLEYFMEKSKTVCASTLWAQYSMLKSTLNIEQNIDISTYSELIAFMKRENNDNKNNNKRTKSKILTTEQIEQFLKEAPDRQYLMIKVALILGIAGACKGNELIEMSIDDVTESGSVIICKTTNTKSKIKRSFIVKDPENNDIKLTEICKKYIALRRKDTPHSRFFVQFRDNKCTSQAVGINYLGKLPSKIADYLNLPDATAYTGHCFRRTSASLLADSGATIDTLKQYGGWRSGVIAKGYVKNSIKNKKIKIEQIDDQQDDPLATTTSPDMSNAYVQLTSDDKNRFIQLVNCNNVNVHITISQKD